MHKLSKHLVLHALLVVSTFMGTAITGDLGIQVLQHTPFGTRYVISE